MPRSAQWSVIFELVNFELASLNRRAVWPVLTENNFQLIPLDFVNLSRTCRFLHWRMFTLCKCYAPYKVRLVIKDAKIVKDRSWDSMPKMVYFFDGDISSRDDLLDEESRKYYSGRRGHRGIFVRQPSCLKKPFIFECLRLYLYVRVSALFRTH